MAVRAPLGVNKWRALQKPACERCDLSSTRYQDRIRSQSDCLLQRMVNFRYEIRSNLEEYNRIARESELTRA